MYRHYVKLKLHFWLHLVCVKAYGWRHKSCSSLTYGPCPSPPHARTLPMPTFPLFSPLLSYLQNFLAKPSMHHYKHAMFSVVSVEPLTTTPPLPSTNPNAWTTSPVSHLNRSLLTSPKGRGETKINKQYIIICVYYFSKNH